MPLSTELTELRTAIINNRAAFRTLMEDAISDFLAGNDRVLARRALIGTITVKVVCGVNGPDTYFTIRVVNKG